VLSDLDVAVFVENDDEWLQRLAAPESRPARVRLVGAAASVALVRRALADATAGDPDVAVYDNEVTPAGRLELLPFLREQSISITAHRFGNPDRTFEGVI
jgi:RHH-type proline utilization regulon transcriptional repressor/proline dehydrogenase/delta 1-pyrroline-5-carboxylate dehydrogenase